MSPPPSPTTYRVDAPAKVNLCLELLGKRPDGFHQLRTLMATVGWRDTLCLTNSPEDNRLSLAVSGADRLIAGVPTDQSNLVLKSLELLRQEARRPLGAAVHLHKRIPNQAGLGGGSSDAAAALVAGNRLWGLGLEVTRLATIGAQLGSDIPFFVYAISNSTARAAIATGRGETIKPCKITAGIPTVILAPPTGLSTAEVYQACEPSDYVQTEKVAHTDEVNNEGLNQSERVAQALNSGNLSAASQNISNGLQSAAKRLCPWLNEVASAFTSAGCRVHQLSGSGSAYFGLVRTMGEARRIAARLQSLRLGQSFATTIG